jgi:uncharacterized protein YndB with AHSA1/START domain
MASIDVYEQVDRPIQKVWDLLTDHQSMNRWANTTSGYKVTLQKEGASERNGKGAVRRVKLPGMSLLEEVVHFDSPVEMRYTIREGMVGLQAHLGTLKLTERDGRTHIHWHVDAKMKPLHPMWFLSPITVLLFKHGFQKALTNLRTELEAPTAR